MNLSAVCKGLIVALASDDGIVVKNKPNLGSFFTVLRRYNVKGINATIDKNREKSVFLEYHLDNICNTPDTCAPCGDADDTVAVGAPIRQLIDNFTAICSQTFRMSKTQYEAYCSSATDGNYSSVSDAIQVQLVDLFSRAIVAAHKKINAYAFTQLSSYVGLHTDGSALKTLQPYSPANNYTPIPNWNRPVEMEYIDAEADIGDLIYLSGTDLQPMFNNAQTGGFNAAGVNVGINNAGFAAAMSNNYYYEPLLTTGNLLTIDPRKVLFLTYSSLRRNYGIAPQPLTIAQLMGNVNENADPLNTVDIGKKHYRFSLPDPYLSQMGVRFYWDAHIVVETKCDDWSFQVWVDTNIAVAPLPYANCGNVAGILEWAICQPEEISCATEKVPTTPIAPRCIILDAAIDCAEVIIGAGTIVTFTPTAGTPVIRQTTVETRLSNNRDLWLLLGFLDMNIQYNVATDQVLYYGDAPNGSTLTIIFSGGCPINIAGTVGACAEVPIVFNAIPDEFNANATDGVPTAKKGAAKK